MLAASRFAVLATCVLVATSWGAPLRAQIGGTVVDSNGTPVPAARVEAWSDSGRLRVFRTAADGRFEFPAPVAALTASLYAHAFGYRAARAEVRPGMTEFTIRLRPDPFPIEGVVVEAEAEVCSGGEDPEAARLWDAAASRYERGIDSLGVATYLASSIRTVPAGEIGPVEIQVPGTLQRGSAPLFRASWRRRVERSGYARPLSAPSPDGAFEAWGYPPLEADFAVHFVDPVFRKLHRFSFESSDPGGWLLRFCPREDDRPEIRGTLRISSDTTLVMAEWSFLTPEPQEGAGGRAVFMRPDRADVGEAYLLPVEGLFWRSVGRGRYLQRYERFEGWLTSPGDSVPFLPVRERQAEPSVQSRQ